MIYGKRTSSVIAAVIGLAILSIPVAAQDGSTDAAAGGGVEIEVVQTGSANTPVESSGETDSHGNEQIEEAPAQDRLVYVDGMGETDQFAGDVVGSGLRLAFADIGQGDSEFEVSPSAGRIVLAYAGETDQHAGMESVEVPNSYDAIYVLLRQPEDVSNLT
jgi:hypothetical protein